MKKREMIRELTRERILLDAAWIEENDPELFEWITSSKYWGRGSDRNPDPSGTIVELQFGEDGVKYYPDGVKQSLDNQPVWGDGNWEDWSTEDIEKYYKLLK